MTNVTFKKCQIELDKDRFLSYQTVGNGTPLVFIHGWGHPWHINNDFLAPLSKQYRLFLIDLPGYGESPIGPLRGDINDYVRILGLFLKQLKIEDAVLIGHSMGSVVILKYLQRYHKQNRSFFFGLPLGEKVPWWAGILYRTHAEKLLLRSKFISRLMADYIARETQKIAGKQVHGRHYKGQVVPRILVYNVLSVLMTKTYEIYQLLYVKPVLIYGERERFRLFCEKNHVPSIIIPDCGHAPMVEKPQASADLLLKLIKDKYHHAKTPV